MSSQGSANPDVSREPRGSSSATTGSDMGFVQKTKKDDWVTPDWLIDGIDRHVGIDVDPFAGPATSHGRVNYGPHTGTNGLVASWNVRRDPYERTTAFVNPPYSAGMKRRALQKGISEWLAGHVDRVLFLLPDSTDVRSWWQAYIRAYCRLTWFPAGRVKFIDPETGERGDSPPCNSALCIAGDVPESFVDWLCYGDDRYPEADGGDVVARPIGGERPW